MTKTVLALLLGAVCASSWWALSRWPNWNDGVLVVPAVLSTIGTLLWVAIETQDTLSK